MSILVEKSLVEIFPTFVPIHLSNFNSHWFLKPIFITAQLLRLLLHLSALGILFSADRHMVENVQYTFLWG